MSEGTGAAGETLLHSFSDGVLRITLNRPEMANAVTAEMRDGLIALLDGAERDSETRAILIAANGKNFCGGADVGLLGRRPVPTDGMKRIMYGAQRVISGVLDCSKPIVAAVQGAAAGLGAHLAFACDLVVAAEDAGFIEVFVNRGIVVDSGGAYLLPRRIGLQKAKEMVFFGDKLPAREALALGLVNKIVPQAELLAAAEAYVARLASGPTIAITLAKRQLNRSQDIDRATAFLEEAMSQELNARAEDAQEGIKAFQERRKPAFKGQ